LNKIGRLKIVEDAVCISSANAHAVIDAELERLGEPEFPDTRRHEPVRVAADRGPA
jgi:hypothetical protein